MAINLATKFSPKVDERFSLKSLTEKAVNKNYDWIGVDTVEVYQVETSPLNNYVRSGLQRYGTPSDLGDKKQSLKVKQDKGFTYVIDKGDSSSQLTIKDVNKSLKRQLDEVVVPFIDQFRLTTWVGIATANNAVATAAITSANAFEEFLKGRKHLVDKKVPAQGRLCYATPEFINQIQLDPRFTLNSDKAQTSNYNGFAGKASGVTFIEVPTEYLPEGTNFLLTHPIASVSPKKLEDYKIHEKPQGISGALVEGRTLFDCFVLDAKKDALFVHKAS